MASANVAKRADGRYRVRWRDDQRKEHARHFIRQSDAKDFAADVRMKLQQGDLPVAARRRASVEQAYVEWLAAHPEWATTTRERNASVWRTHLRERWGSVRLSDLSRASVQEWAGTLNGARSTKIKTLGVLSSIVAQAVLDRWITRNPLEGVRVERAQPVKRRPYLTRAQVEDLAEAAGEPQAALIVRFLAHTGIRVGELAALRVEDIRASTGHIRISRSETEVNGRLVSGPPKNGSPREFYLPTWMVEELAERLGGDPQQRIFTSAHGDTLRVRNMRRAWFDRAAADIGVPDLTPHSLRHTAASLAISAGLSVLQVQRQLGHARPSITLDTYSDLFQGDAVSGAQRLDKAQMDWLSERKLRAERAEEDEQAAREAALWAVAHQSELKGW